MQCQTTPQWMLQCREENVFEKARCGKFIETDLTNWVYSSSSLSTTTAAADNDDNDDDDDDDEE